MRIIILITLFISTFAIGESSETIVITNSMPNLIGPVSKNKEEKQNMFSGKVEELIKTFGAKLLVPSKPEGALRIVSYNVHNWAGPGNEAFGFRRSPAQREKEFGRIVSMIKNLNPDIVVFEEARAYDNQAGQKGAKRAEAFKEQGFLYNEFIPGGNEEQNNGPFGNLIIYKQPFKAISKAQYKNQDSAYIKATFDLSAMGKSDLVV